MMTLTVSTGGKWRDPTAMARLEAKYGDAIRGVSISEPGGPATLHLEHSLYFVRSEDGGLKLLLIDTQQCGGGMANCGGTDWREGDPPEKAVEELLAILSRDGKLRRALKRLPRNQETSQTLRELLSFLVSTAKGPAILY